MPDSGRIPRLAPPCATTYSAATPQAPEKGCAVIARPTPEALAAYNESSESEKMALFHVTC